jgi:hypothetical protein
MNLPIQLRIWDEKYRCWDREPILVYTETPIIKQGRIIDFSIGRQDCTGQEIFVNDILEFTDSISGQPKVLGRYLVTQQYLDAINDAVFDCLFYHECDSIKDSLKIIGNKHEHPEFLTNYIPQTKLFKY